MKKMYEWMLKFEKRKWSDWNGVYNAKLSVDDGEAVTICVNQGFKLGKRSFNTQ